MSIGQTIERGAAVEHQLLEPVLGLQDSLVVRALTPLSKLADETPLMIFSGATLVAGLVLQQPRMLRIGARMLAAHVVANAAKTILKGSVDRLRPNAVEERPRIKPGSGTDNKAENAFPSGHTAGAIAIAQALAHEVPRYAAPTRVIAGVAGATQVPRGAHYLTDVVSGAIVGWLSERIVTRLVDRIERAIVQQRATKKPSATE